MPKFISSLFLLALLISARAEDPVVPSTTPEDVELPKPDADGWISLFNGKDLKGWYGHPKLWKVENGYISGKIDNIPGNTFLIFNKPFSNFILEAKCMLLKGKDFTNSGIQYRSKVVDPKKWVVFGYQADAGEGYWGSLYDEGVRNKALFPCSPEAAKTIKLYDDWNSYVITADGTKVKQELNGVLAGEFDDQDTVHRSLTGILALQYHSPGKDFEVRFKDIRIKILPDTK